LIPVRLSSSIFAYPPLAGVVASGNFSRCFSLDTPTKACFDAEREGEKVASLVKDFLPPPRVTVLSAVGKIRRNIWSEAQALQGPQRADVQGRRSTATNAATRTLARRATITPAFSRR
jgi:hypothetical protein